MEKMQHREKIESALAAGVGECDCLHRMVGKVFLIQWHAEQIRKQGGCVHTVVYKCQSSKTGAQMASY